MRTENIEVKLTIPIPYDKPELNGTVYTREAIEAAINSLYSNLPILFQANENDVLHTIGDTDTATHSVEWDEENQVCRFTISGNINYGGISGFVHDIKNRKVTSFEFLCIGLSD